jgi:hypothetical protein
VEDKPTVLEEERRHFDTGIDSVRRAVVEEASD